MQNYLYYTIFQGKREWIRCEFFQNKFRITMNLFTLSFNRKTCVMKVINRKIKLSTFFQQVMNLLCRIYFFAYDFYLVEQILIGLDLRGNLIGSVDNGGMIFFP